MPAVLERLRPAHGEFVRAKKATIEGVWKERWGSPVITPERSYEPNEVEGLEMINRQGQLLGLVTYYQARYASEAEIVTLDSLLPDRGLGTLLLQVTERALTRRGVRHAHLFTTSDNLHALNFFVRRGWRLMNVHLYAIDEIRKVKPSIPLMGLDGLPLRDAWQLMKRLL